MIYWNITDFGRSSLKLCQSTKQNPPLSSQKRGSDPFLGISAGYPSLLLYYDCPVFWWGSKKDAEPYERVILWFLALLCVVQYMNHIFLA